MRWAARWLVILAIASFLAVPAAAFAGDAALARPTSAEARGHLDLGNKFYNLGEFEKAIVEYKAGALIEHAPVFDYNLGQAYRQLTRYREALWHYQRFLSRGQPTGELLGAVTAFMTEMHVHLENRALTMPPTGPEPSPSSMPPTNRQAPVITSIEKVSVQDPSTSRAWYKDRVAIGLAGAGILGIGIASGLLVSASNLRDEANMTPNQEGFRQLSSKADARSLAGTIIGVGGGGLLLAGILKLALHSDASTTVSAWRGTSGSGLVISGSF